ncbi:MAG: cytochrome c [Pseudomonadota bacterium]
MTIFARLFLAVPVMAFATACMSMSADETATTGQAGAEPAVPGDAERGKALVEAKCLRCHARDVGQASPNEAAPSFATLFTHYPPDYIAEAFAEGVFVGHGEMPPFSFETGEIDDLVAYLNTLDQDGGEPASP